MKPLKVKTTIEPEERYFAVGGLVVNMPLLENESTLLIKYKSFSAIKGVKRIKLSPPYQQFWIQLVRNGEINYGLLQQCTVDDIDLFENLLKKMRIKLRFDRSKAQVSTPELIERMHVLQGEIDAGNDNQIIKDECIDIVKRLNRIGKISNGDMDEIITELNE